MTAPVMDHAVSHYVDACEEFLDDLDEPTRAQLRRDIAEIVAEVCSELDGAPADLVGPPFRFVAELRSAAGVPPRAAPVAPHAGSSRRGLRARVRSLWQHPALQWIRGLVPELRPAWWVARGILLAWLLGRATGARGPSWMLNVLPHWPVFESTVIGLAATAAAIYASVEAGRRRPTGMARALVVAASLVAVVFALSLASDASRWTAGGRAAFDEVSTQTPWNAPPPYLGMRSDGSSFRPLVIGSDVTGETVEVIGFDESLRVVDDLLTTAPPAAIFIDQHGQQQRPGTRDAIEDVLNELADRGHLNR